MGVIGKGKLTETKNPDDTTLNANGFVGVDPIYQNYAEDVQKPLAAEGNEDLKQAALNGGLPEKDAQAIADAGLPGHSKDDETEKSDPADGQGSGQSSDSGKTPDPKAGASTTKAKAGPAPTDTTL